MKFFLIILFFSAILACAGKENPKANKTEVAEGAVIYKKYCALCHGSDGKLGLNGSKDITVSTLTKAERIELIRNGKNTMTPFGSILTDQEIEAVAEYTMTMK